MLQWSVHIKKHIDFNVSELCYCIYNYLNKQFMYIYQLFWNSLLFCKGSDLDLEFIEFVA